MEIVTWAWSDGKPSVQGVGQDYDVYTLYLYARQYGRLPEGLNFAGLVWVALEAQKLGDLDEKKAAKHIVKQSWRGRNAQQVLDLLRSEAMPHLVQDDWKRLCVILDLPIGLMEAAVVTIEEAPS